MSFPVMVSVGPLTVPAHLVFETLGYAAGFRLYLRLRKRWPSGPPLSLEQTMWVLAGAVAGALVGARGLAWLDALPARGAEWTDWRIVFQGKTIVGALLGGWAGVQVAKKALRLAHPSGDVYVFPLILGMSLGRVGCFLAGLTDHTYGVPTGLPWGVDFGDGLARHPTQLYEIVFLLGAAAFFAWRIRTSRQAGCLFSQFLLAYLAFRFGVEFLKPRALFAGFPLSAIQVASLVGVFYTARHRNDTCCGRAADLPAAAPGASPPSVEPTAADRALAARAPAEETYELTVGLCPECLEKVDAKILQRDGAVYMEKFCPVHGVQDVRVSGDASWWLASRRATRPATAPLTRLAERRHGCPFDCGLCPAHEQHSCVAVLEITSRCDQRCSVCFADSGPAGRDRSLAEIERMLDTVVTSEGRVAVLQVSGGEPTVHPELFAVLDAAKRRPIGHLMLNTNGRRLAEDPDLAKRLASYLPGFEVYLQFDSRRPESLRALRGADLTRVRERALDALQRHGVPATLVVTLAAGVNDGEVGEILEFALAHPAVRGVAFQPVQHAGRRAGAALRGRLTISDVRDDILRQQSLFTAADVVPVPCHPDAIAMAYAVRVAGRWVPLSRFIDPATLAAAGGDTIAFEQDPAVRARLARLFSIATAGTATPKDLAPLCCGPTNGAPGLAYDDVFRVTITRFMDAWDLDLRSVKRSCVHVVTGDGRLVPFDVYNILHRGGDTLAAGREAS